jgi:hypothetical protein
MSWNARLRVGVAKKHSGLATNARYNHSVTLRAYLVLAALLLPIAAGASFGGCGSSVSYVTPSGGGGSGGKYVFVDGGTAGSAPKPDATPKPDALPDYTDPGCPNKPPPKEQFQCDPYKQNCMKKGEACFIYTDYPEEPCGQEIYGSFCAPAGMGKQGDPCGGGHYCSGGYVCVITGSGTQCVQLCNLKGISGCPDGLVCEPIDVKGFGGCL